MKSNPVAGRLAKIGTAGLATALFAFSGVTGSSAPAEAQLFGPSPFETDKNVAVPELSRMIPSVDVRTRRVRTGLFRWETVNTLSLFAVTDQGISTRHWKSDVGAWTTWDHLGNPSGTPLVRISGSGDDPGLDFDLPLLQGWGQGQADFVAYQGLAQVPNRPGWPDYATAIMNVSSSPGLLQSAQSTPTFPTLSSPGHPGDFDHFDPQAGFTSIVPNDVNGKPATNQYVKHMFGTGLPRGYMDSNSFTGATVPLIELRQQTATGNPTWVNHGTPPDHTGVDLGPGGTTSVIHNWSNPDLRAKRHYAFVATDPYKAGGGDGLNGPAIAYLEHIEGQPGQFSWHDLGSPAGQVYGEPVVATTYSGVPVSGGLGQLRVHVVAQNGSQDFEVYSRTHNGVGWSQGWRREGAPTELRGERFKLTSAVTWYNGSSSQGANLRMHFFGYAEPANGQPGGLVEYRWTGNSWGFSPVRYAPNGESLRTTHAVVSDLSKEDRIVVIVRTTSGRIYEYFQEFRNGSVVDEGWKDLSWESKLKQGPTIPWP